MRENRLRWYEHVLRRSTVLVVRRDKMITISGMKRDKGKPKNSLIKTTNKDSNTLNLIKHGF